jgi:hypothetical protein
MKGVAIASILIAALAFCSIAAAMPPLIPPVQYEQFCENQKVAGTGVIDVSTSIIDKKIALEYYNTMTGDGAFELDQEQAYSQNPDKLRRDLAATSNEEDEHWVDGPKGGAGAEPAVITDPNIEKKKQRDHDDKTNLNLYENTKMTYSGETPLVGGKYLNSKKFYGGIGASVQEMFAVNEMEKEQEAFFTSTTPFENQKHVPGGDNESPNLIMAGRDRKDWTPEHLIKQLERAGRDTHEVDKLMGNNPAHLIGIDTKNTFNGTWGTDALWHKIFYKDIKSHEMFTGKFEAEKLLKFHEYPVAETHAPCAGIDC